jgi:hypothetical protein
MGSHSFFNAPKVNLTKYVNTGDGQWRFCQVLVSANGRIMPDCVAVAGRPETHREGAYYVEWYEKGTRRRRSVGKNAIEAPPSNRSHPPSGLNIKHRCRAGCSTGDLCAPWPFVI